MSTKVWNYMFAFGLVELGGEVIAVFQKIYTSLFVCFVVMSNHFSMFYMYCYFRVYVLKIYVTQIYSINSRFYWSEKSIYFLKQKSNKF